MTLVGKSIGFAMESGKALKTDKHGSLLSVGEWRGIWKFLGVATSTPSDLFKMNTNDTNNTSATEESLAEQTDTPRTDSCPHCCAEESRIKFSLRTLQTLVMSLTDRSEKAEAEVERLRNGIKGIEFALKTAQTDYHALLKEVDKIKSEVLKEKEPTISSKTHHYHHESYCRKCGLIELD